MGSLRRRRGGQADRGDSLPRDDEVNPEEDGTDAFDRLFALERAGSDQDIIFTIDESIRAIDEGKYGVCEGCASLIEKPIGGFEFSPIPEGLRQRSARVGRKVGSDVDQALITALVAQLRKGKLPLRPFVRRQ